MVNYMGIFFEEEEVKKIKAVEPVNLNNQNDSLHCTFKYRPSLDEIRAMDEVVGQEITVYLIGYGCDGQNSGFEIAFDEAFNQYYFNTEVKDGEVVYKKKHITVSLADGAKPVNTKDLNFERLHEPIAITGRLGYWIVGKNIQAHISYDKALTEERTLK